MTVRGTGFFADAAAARCRFGEAAVPARRVARGVLECVAPRAGAPGYAAVEVAMNARDYTADGVQFEYRPPAHVRALAPSAGPAEGGALVGVTGSGFSHRAALLGALACRFNRSAAAAAWRGASALHCVAPAHGAGVVGVEVTQNGQQHTASGVQFEYRHAVAHGVHPRGGPARGGSLLEVRGGGGHAAATRGAV